MSIMEDELQSADYWREKLYIYEPNGRYVGFIEIEDPLDAIIGLLLEADYHLYSKQI